MDILLRTNLDLLKTVWHGVSLEEVTAMDLLHSDGAVAGAKFKLIFMKEKHYVSTIYMMENGSWLIYTGTSDIKSIVNTWVEQVRAL
jgi:protein gp37